MSRGQPGCYPAPLLRPAFVLREMEGLSTEEAARKLGVTANMLKARLWCARQQLTARLGPRLRGEDAAAREASAASILSAGPWNDHNAFGTMPSIWGTDWRR